MELTPAAQTTLRNQCHTRTGCGRCQACRAVLAVARRVPPAAATEEETPPERPSARDTKAAWVEYAVAQGMARETAEEFTKADLMGTLT